MKSHCHFRNSLDVLLSSANGPKSFYRRHTWEKKYTLVTFLSTLTIKV